MAACERPCFVYAVLCAPLVHFRPFSFIMWFILLSLLKLMSFPLLLNKPRFELLLQLIVSNVEVFGVFCLHFQFLSLGHEGAVSPITDAIGLFY